MKIKNIIYFSVCFIALCACSSTTTSWGSDESSTSFNDSFNDLDAFNQGITPNIGGSSMRESPAIQEATMRPYQVAGKWYYPEKVSLNDKFDGWASWYGEDFHSKKTSNGETYNMHAHTAAHKTFPMNTVVKVLNVENGKSTIVRINDRGPFVEGRIIDLSAAAAKDIDMTKKGTAKVRLEIIGFGGVVNKDDKQSVKSLQSDDVLNAEFKVDSTPKSMSGGIFGVQVGSFRKKEGALTTQEQFSHMPPYKSVIKEYEVDNQPLYRVFLVGFKSEEEVRDFLKKNKQIQGGFFVRE